MTAVVVHAIVVLLSGSDMTKRTMLAGKNAVVTGSASGIGRAIALMFAHEGASVVLVDIERQGGRDAARAIGRNGGRAAFIYGDVSRAGDCDAVISESVRQLGTIDILCNNVGVVRRATILETSEDEWDRLMAVNVKSVFLLSRRAVPVMAERGGGAIINTASGWGLVGGRRAAAYCASKGAVVQLTRAMALDHAEQNIRVNCICPGDTDTPMLRAEAEQLGEPDARFRARAAQRPIPRLGRPEDIAQAAVYLASDAAAFVTGVSLVVDGGALAGIG